MLYVVATPIGNLGDMSPRAVEVLKSVALIAAEDTRMTMKLTQRFGIETPLTSCHRHNEQGKAEGIVRRMLEEGIDVAVVTDAGTPAISDPGTILVRQVAEAGIEVVAVPGPSAMAAAMSVSGIDVTEFTFLGFLPREKKDLQAALRSARQLAAQQPPAVADGVGDVDERHTVAAAACGLRRRDREKDRHRRYPLAENGKNW